MNASIDFISTTIGDIADVISGPFGSQLHESDYKEHGTPIVTVEHLSPYGLTTQNLPFVGDEDKERLNRYTLKQGDIVFSRVGSVDRCSLVREKEEGWLFSGRLLRIRLNNSEKEMATLLSYIFQTNRFTHQVRSKAVGQTMPSLNNGIVKSLQISIPRNPKLQKIYCDTLINIDQKINLLTKKKEALETYKKGLMQKIFSQELRFKREDGTDYPEWRMVALGEVSELIMGQSPSSSSYNDIGQGLPLAQGKADFKGLVFSSTRFTSEPTKIIPANTILMSVRAPVGFIGYADKEVCIGRGMCAIKTAHRNYIHAYLTFYQTEWRKVQQGSTFEAVSGKDIKDVKVPMPTSELEERRITECFNLVNERIKVTANLLNGTVSLKKGLLQQMFV